MADENQTNPEDQAAPEGGDVQQEKKPMNPEMEAVSANQPASAEASASTEVSADESADKPAETEEDKPDAAQEPDLEKASEDLNASLNQVKESSASAEAPAEEKKPEETPAEPEAEPEEPAEEKPDKEAPADEPAAEEPKEEKPAEEVKEEERKEEEEKPVEEAKPDEKEEEEKPAEEPKKEEEKPAEEPEKGKKKKSDKKKKVPPKKIGKDKSKRKSNTKFLVGILLGFILLFIAFIVLMVLMIAGGGEDSAVLSAFGIDAAGIKSFLLTIVNLSFGFLAFIFFVLAVIGVFRLLFAKKGDKEAKGKGIRMSLVGILPLMFVMFIWLFLFNYIGGIQIAAQQVKAEILILQPTELEGLQAPLEVTYSAENVLKSLTNRGFKLTGARWDLNGDGDFETELAEVTISYLYNRRGTYNVGLEVDVADEENPQHQFFLVLKIGEAVFSADPPTGTAPQEIIFDATDILPPGKKLQSLDWDFDGDGTYELTGKDNIRPRYTFEQIGTWKVHLRVVDADNLVENYYRDIEITQGGKPLLTAEIEASPGLSGPIPLQIRFDGEKSESLKGQIVNYEWDFGDGSNLQVGRSVSHVYNEPGIYTVTLTVREDSGKEEYITVEVNAGKVTSAPESIIKTDPPVGAEGVLAGTLPFKVSFDASGSTDVDNDIVDYEWDFGMNGGLTGQNVDFTFEEMGTYEVTLLVRDSEKQEGTATLTVKVEEPGVRSVIIADPEEGIVPLTVKFDGSGSSAFEGKIVSYEWDFDDETAPTITSAQVTHKYDVVGSYAVKLKVVTDQDESAVGEKTVYVREVPLRACFQPSRNHGETPLAVTFDAKCSTGAVANYNWDFGDGEKSESRKPAHTFENPGTYNVTLEVSDDKSNVDFFSDVITAEGTLQ